MDFQIKKLITEGFKKINFRCTLPIDFQNIQLSTKFKKKSITDRFSKTSNTDRFIE